MLLTNIIGPYVFFKHILTKTLYMRAVLSISKMFFCFFKIFIYLCERESTHACVSGAGGRAEGQGQADSVLSSEPHLGLDLRTLRS